MSKKQSHVSHVSTVIQLYHGKRPSAPRAWPGHCGLWSVSLVVRSVRTRTRRQPPAGTARQRRQPHGQPPLTQRVSGSAVAQANVHWLACLMLYTALNCPPASLLSALLKRAPTYACLHLPPRTAQAGGCRAGVPGRRGRRLGEETDGHEHAHLWRGVVARWYQSHAHAHVIGVCHMHTMALGGACWACRSGRACGDVVELGKVA